MNKKEWFDIIKNKNKNISKILEDLDNGWDINTTDINKNSVLIFAVCNNIDIVKLLLKYPNIDINHQDNEGNTALIWASYYSDLRSINELIKHPNIDVNIQDINGNTALIYACFYSSSLEIVKILLQNKNNDVNIMDHSKYTALMWACKADNIDIVKEILKLPNVDLTIKNFKGLTAKDLTKSPKIKELLNNYSKTNFKDSKVINTKYNYIEL